MRASLLLALLLLAGCSSRHVWSGDIEPAGLVIEKGVSFRVRAEGLEEHALYVRQMEQQVADQLVLEGWHHDRRADLELLVDVNWLDEGDERGTLAECRITVYVTRGGKNWRFEARGDSAGRWKEDRVPTAISNTATAVVERLLRAQRD